MGREVAPDVAFDVRAALVQPFDARGLYQDAVLSMPRLVEEQRGIASF